MDQELPSNADVVVVGGGVMGTSTAYFLAAETDRDVCLLEKSAIGAGSTGDSSAILRHHYGANETYTRMAVWSHEVYRRFEERVGEPLAHDENPMVRFAADGTPAAEFARGGYDCLSEFDVPVTWVDSEAFDDRYPLLELAAFDFGVSDDTAGYSDGTDAASGFARAARREGASVLTGIEVTEILTNDGSVAGVATDAGKLDCGDIVLAAGPWTGPLAETAGVDVPIRREREQVLLLDPPADVSVDTAELPTVSLPGGDWYMRPDFGGGVLIATHHSGGDCDPDTYKDKADESVILRLADQLAATVPALEAAEIKGTYCGVYSTTPDNDFVLDQAGPQGCYLACGFSGHGFKHGPAVGRIMSDLVATGTTDLVDIEQFSLSRFEDDPAGNSGTAADSEYVHD